MSSTATENDMPSRLRLVWENPHPQPHLRNDLAMLRMLADTLAGSVRCGYLEGARQLASIHRLSPLALSVVATRMFESGLSEEQILKVV